jgi:hypothetical protein
MEKRLDEIHVSSHIVEAVKSKSTIIGSIKILGILKNKRQVTIISIYMFNVFPDIFNSINTEDIIQTGT